MNEHAIPDGVVPRWEWRTFGHAFETADAVLAGQDPERSARSEELYFLSLASDASVKVRDDLMDVKVCFEVDERGLELWAPTLKTGFAVKAHDVTTVLEALGAVPPEPLSDEYALNQLVKLIDSLDGLKVVTVEKKRRHFRVDGCMVESTEITADGHAARTIAIESPDSAEVTRTIERLELTDRPNSSVARGLQALVGFGESRLAVIDVGTNSVKYHIEEHRADGTERTLVDRAEITRLGEGQTDDGLLAEPAIDRTVEAIVAMAADARGMGPVDIVAVGTAGLRRAPNRALLVDAVRARAAVDVEVISGPEEARLAYLAATSALPAVDGDLVVFDSGGGSTQFTFGRGGHVDDQFSLDIGAVRVAERFGLAGAVDTTALDDVFTQLDDDLARLDDRTRPEAIVAIGGTATNLAAVSHRLETYDPDVVHGTVLDLDELDRQIELYRTSGADGRRAIPGLQPARAEVILGGACIVRTLLDKLGHDHMTVSDRGLRHGVVIDRSSGRPPADDR